MNGPQPKRPLSLREQQALTLILEGRSYKDVARAMDIATNTAKTYARTIFYRYGVHTRAELISTFAAHRTSVMRAALEKIMGDDCPYPRIVAYDALCQAGELLA